MRASGRVMTCWTRVVREPAETAVGRGRRNTRGNLDDSGPNLTGQTRKHVATLEERDRGRSRPTWDRQNGHATALHSNRDRAHRGTTGAGSARSPSRDEETHCSGDLTPRNGKNYGGGTPGCITTIRGGTEGTDMGRFIKQPIRRRSRERNENVPATVATNLTNLVDPTGLKDWGDQGGRLTIDHNFKHPKTRRYSSYHS